MDDEAAIREFYERRIAESTTIKNKTVKGSTAATTTPRTVTSVYTIATRGTSSTTPSNTPRQTTKGISSAILSTTSRPTTKGTIASTTSTTSRPTTKGTSAYTIRIVSTKAPYRKPGPVKVNEAVEPAKIPSQAWDGEKWEKAAWDADGYRPNPKTTTGYSKPMEEWLQDSEQPVKNRRNDRRRGNGGRRAMWGDDYPEWGNGGSDWNGDNRGYPGGSRGAGVHPPAVAISTEVVTPEPVPEDPSAGELVPGEKGGIAFYLRWEYIALGTFLLHIIQLCCLFVTCKYVNNKMKTHWHGSWEIKIFLPINCLEDVTMKIITRFILNVSIRK